MASFQIGSEIAAPLSLTAPFPMDARNVANSVEQVLTEYPSSCRYLGLKIWIENENKLYVFSKHTLSDGTESTGLTDDDFQPFNVGKDIAIDSTLSENSKNPVENRAVKSALDLKQSKLVVDENMDSSPVQDSKFPITSGAVYSALSNLRGDLSYVGLFENLSDESLLALSPLPNDWITILSDDTHNNKKCKYIYAVTDGVGKWEYAGELSEASVQIDDVNVSSDKVWSSKNTKEKIDEIYQEYKPSTAIIGGKKYIHAYSIYEAKVDIPAEENITWDESKFDLVVGLNSKNVYVEGNTLFISKIVNTKCEVSDDTLVFIQ